jgi:two-component system OmpR family sensor kinase
VKYGRGEVVLEASADTGTGGVEVRVHDDGPGVPGAFVDQLFKSFARGEGAGGTPGSGLGLAIVWGLAEANGAHAWYQPREPHGSTFALWLPAAG